MNDSGSNGSAVTWRELNLVREAWKREVELIISPLTEAVERLEEKVDKRTAFWTNAWLLLVVAVVGAFVGTGVWFLFG